MTRAEFGTALLTLAQRHGLKMACYEYVQVIPVYVLVRETHNSITYKLIAHLGVPDTGLTMADVTRVVALALKEVGRT